MPRLRTDQAKLPLPYTPSSGAQRNPTFNLTEPFLSVVEDECETGFFVITLRIETADLASLLGRKFFFTA